MALDVEHELHQRRRTKNAGVGLLLLGFVAIIFGLTVVKVLSLGDISQMESFDHVARPQIEPAAIEAAEEARQ
ncbi:hypothetical protein [Pelagovum pacificum]|uniref:Cytochrome C oxidase assembly protein n=1 Tax=Pelagovum pacificum TaxID=2588711 RepID=A0A5C5GFJ9_9RHOB|nr:hypothetical protein [Pelagovum pacificum]QQA44132.1 hypothetical protein I8N54_06015 [Pelagovum pacificum]TNY32739.1 hypothetical protein FHY64_05545 [Pelagovum pacificum]